MGSQLIFSAMAYVERPSSILVEAVRVQGKQVAMDTESTARYLA